MSPSPAPQTSPKDPQPDTDADVQAAALKAKRIASLEAKVATLHSRIAEAEAKREEMSSQLKNPNPSQTVTHHIHLLHAYNSMRDIGTGLMGIIAENRGVRVRDVYAEFGVAVKD